MTPMSRDEIIDEVRAAREKLLADAGGDLESLIARLRKLEAQEKRPVVVLPPRRPAQKKDEVA
jgi:hypothetical protein